MGAKILTVKGEFNKKGEMFTWLATTHLENCIGYIEYTLDTTLRACTCPLDPDYHPELDESNLLSDNMKSKYQMLVGCGQWAIKLGQIDITYAVSMLSRYNMMPCKGHF